MGPPLHPPCSAAEGAGRSWRPWVSAAILALVVFELLGLAITGVWLWFNYLPSIGQGSEQSARSIHRLLANAVGVTVGVWAVIAFTHPTAKLPRRIAIPVVLLAGVAVASVPGRLLPWDALAMWVPPEGQVSGYIELFEPVGDVRFVLIGSQEVSASSFGLVVLAHLGVSLLLTVTFSLLAGAAVVRWFRRSRRPHPATAEG